MVRSLLVVCLVATLALVSVGAWTGDSDSALQPMLTEITMDQSTEVNPTKKPSAVITDALSEDFSEAGMRAKFNELKAKRKKPYVSQATEEKAFRAFYKNRLKVRELNAKYSKPGQKLFTSTGKFADIEAEEFAAKFLNFRADQHSNAKPSATASPTLIRKSSKVKDATAGGHSTPAHPTVATKTAKSSAKRVRDPTAGGHSKEVMPTPGAPAKKSAATKTLSGASKKITALKTKAAKPAKTSLLEVEQEDESELLEMMDTSPCTTPVNGVTGVPFKGALADCAKANGWEAAWCDMSRPTNVADNFCCIPAKKDEIVAKCTARGGKCAPNIRTAGNQCEGNGGKFVDTWEGACPWGAHGVDESSWCCIGATPPPPSPLPTPPVTTKNGCTDSVNGVVGVLRASGTLTECAKAQGWAAAWTDVTRDPVKGFWCCIPTTPDWIVKQCTAKGGLCGSNQRTPGNTCEGNGGKFVSTWEGYCPVGSSVADGPNADAWCCLGGKPEVPGPTPDNAGNTWLVDYRAATGKTTPVKDQGQCGSCWAHAATEALEAAWIWSGNQQVILSPQAIMDCRATPAEGGSCVGGQFIQAFDQWKAAPSVLLSQYPYTKLNQQCPNLPGQGPKVKSWGWATPKCTGGTCEGLDEQQLLTSLKNYGPIAVTLDATPFQHYNGGVIPADSCAKTIDKLDHAVQLVGYGTDRGGNKFWLIRNSWGADWGENGYVRIEFGKNACGVADWTAFVTA